MLKDDLEPVAKWKLEKTVREQFDRILVEYKEAQDELEKCEEGEANGECEEALKKQKWACAVELGDVIVATIGVISMLGFTLEEVASAVHSKNGLRDYYKVR